MNGLGRRIAYLFIRALGRKTLGLAYSIVASALVLSPATPSNAARAGGVIFPPEIKATLQAAEIAHRELERMEGHDAE